MLEARGHFGKKLVDGGAVVAEGPPAEVDVTDFDRHTEIFEASYRWAKEAIAALEAGGSSAIQAILDSGALERRQAATIAAADRAPGNRVASAAGLGVLNT